MDPTVVVNGTDSTEEKNEDKSTVETESKAEQTKASEPEKPSKTNSTTHRASDDSLTSSSEDEDETPSAKPGDANKGEQLTPSITITIDGAELRLEEATTKVDDGDSNTNANGEGEKVTLAPRIHRRRSSAPFTEKRGFLHKQGGHHKNWKLRYFVLQPGGFMYFKKDPHTKPIREVKLKNMEVSFPTESQREQPFQFHITTRSSWNKRPNWVMAAQSEQDMKAWIEAFKLAGQMGGVSPVHSDAESDTEETSTSVPAS